MENIIKDQFKEDKRPWYREPFVWLIIALPLSAVLAGSYTLYLAVISYDGLVVDDYYKQGLGINKRLEKQEMAEQYGLKPEVQFNHQDNNFRLILNANEKFKYPDNISVLLSHATKLGNDQKIILLKIDGITYQGGLNDLIQGHWNIVIEADDWRIVESAWR